MKFILFTFSLFIIDDCFFLPVAILDYNRNIFHALKLENEGT